MSSDSDSEEEWFQVESSTSEMDKMDPNIEIDIHIPAQKKKQKVDRQLVKNLHQTHLLCLLVSCLWSNKKCNELEFQAILFSLVDIVLVKDLKRVAKSFDEPALAFVAACRSCGLEARLICSLDPMPLSSRKTVNPCMHKWAELLIDGQWTPIDPSDKFEQSFFKSKKHHYVISIDGQMLVKDETRRSCNAWSETLKLRSVGSDTLAFLKNQ